jgi:glycerol-3-phosphate dehydrogenase
LTIKNKNLAMDTYDLLVIGGGINGTGIARDAAGRGLRVLLVEQGDLASATSGWSSKLIHGGLRYLEYYEFRLVREALAEREVLLGIAPHLVRPMLFVLPHERSMRPVWMVRIGLWLYDHLGKRVSLPASSRSCTTASCTAIAAWTTRASPSSTPSRRARRARKCSRARGSCRPAARAGSGRRRSRTRARGPEAPSVRRPS